MGTCISCVENISVSNPLGIGSQVSDPCGCLNGGLVLQEIPVCSCNTVAASGSGKEIIPFGPVGTFTITWTTERKDKFGALPDIKMFTFDVELGKYISTIPAITLNQFPDLASIEISVGNQSGYLILS